MDKESTNTIKRELSYTLKVWQATAIVCLSLIIILFVGVAFNILLMTFTGVLIAVYFHGLADFIVQKTKISRKFSLFISIAGTITLLSVMMWVIGSTVQQQAAQLSHTLYDETERFEDGQWDKFNQELDAKEAEFKTAVGDKKEKLKQEIKELKDKQHQRMMKFREKATARKNHLHDKIEVLHKKMKAANQKNKEKFELKPDSFKKSLAAFNERVAWAFS